MPSGGLSSGEISRSGGKRTDVLNRRLPLSVRQGAFSSQVARGSSDSSPVRFSGPAGLRGIGLPGGSPTFGPSLPGELRGLCDPEGLAWLPGGSPWGRQYQYALEGSLQQPCLPRRGPAVAGSSSPSQRTSFRKTAGPLFPIAESGK